MAADKRTGGACIDTNILALWFLYSEKPYSVRTAHDERIEAALDLLYGIEGGEFKCEFSYPAFALIEMLRVMRDSRVALKIFMSGYSLTHFGQLKGHYSPTNKESRNLFRDLQELLKRIRAAGIKEIPMHFEMGILKRLIMDGGLETIDALNILSAVNNGCRYFITNDGELVRKKETYGVRMMTPLVFLRRSRELRLLR